MGTNHPVFGIGITPACAGKSPVLPAISKCGRGSPPHVRGKVRLNPDRLPTTRITPACAGKSDIASRHCPEWWDHPRMCGEKGQLLDPLFDCGASPPHVRGKGVNVIVNYSLPRITPACAGKRELLPLPSNPTRDHPRMCGEKTDVL